MKTIKFNIKGLDLHGARLRAVKPVRLLPIVVMAGSALLGLKLIALTSGGAYTLTGVESAMAQEAAADEGAQEEAGDPGDIAAAQEAADRLFDTPGEDEGQDDIPIADGLEPGESTQEVLIERLSQRRAELDAREQQVEERMALVEAAEARIDERMAELSAMEERINGTLDAQDAAREEQFASLVAMYESMRARDAAGIFNDLDIAILTRVGKAMDPRKLGPILAEMNPARAQTLTVNLASPDEPGSAQPPVAGGELPQIVGQ